MAFRSFGWCIFATLYRKLKTKGVLGDNKHKKIIKKIGVVGDLPMTNDIPLILFIDIDAYFGFFS